MTLDDLIKSTSAYKIISGEKRRDALSHAYLIVCDDPEYLRGYLKIFAKLIMCETSDGCGTCRACRLIEKEKYADCTFYPAEGTKILSGDVDDMIPQTFIRPLENRYRLFVLCGAENMNASAQNKILKTLEEPPKNVIVLIGATSDYPLLPTIKSRVKKLEIPPFSERALTEALQYKCPDKARLKAAVAVAGGRASFAVNAYESGGAERTAQLCNNIIDNMRSSKDVIKFIDKIDKDNVTGFISAMKEKISGMLKEAVSGGADEVGGYAVGALLAIEELLDEKLRALTFNANVQMTADAILLGMLEEKYKWQKL